MLPPERLPTMHQLIWNKITTVMDPFQTRMLVAVAVRFTSLCFGYR
jgi:hypothetical protein